MENELHKKGHFLPFLNIYIFLKFRGRITELPTIKVFVFALQIAEENFEKLYLIMDSDIICKKFTTNSFTQKSVKKKNMHFCIKYIPLRFVKQS